MVPNLCIFLNSGRRTLRHINWKQEWKKFLWFLHPMIMVIKSSKPLAYNEKWWRWCVGSRWTHREEAITVLVSEKTALRLWLQKRTGFSARSKGRELSGPGHAGSQHSWLSLREMGKCREVKCATQCLGKVLHKLHLVNSPQQEWPDETQTIINSPKGPTDNVW